MEGGGLRPRRNGDDNRPRPAPRPGELGGRVMRLDPATGQWVPEVREVDPEMEMTIPTIPFVTQLCPKCGSRDIRTTGMNRHLGIRYHFCKACHRPFKTEDEELREREYPPGSR
jgi:predicted RNA-binding Zn-ribbon protein involved in translation (DUF1610 family)